MSDSKLPDSKPQVESQSPRSRRDFLRAGVPAQG